jgi:uncharacterized protein YkwD
LLAGSLAIVTTAMIAPSTASASTAGSMDRTVLILVNRDRSSLGLRPLRLDARLATLAAARAGWMAATGTLSHQSSGGDIGRAVRGVGVRASFCGEAIGEANATWGRTVARYLYALWRASPEHWALMISA